METTKSTRDNSDGIKYVKSLRDAVKRRFAGEYLAWIRGGKAGAGPKRGALSPTVWKTICSNLDGLG